MQEVELNTYWKIKDYEELLKQRVSETYMKEFVRGEVNKNIRDQGKQFEDGVGALEKRIQKAEFEMSKVKDSISVQVESL